MNIKVGDTVRVINAECTYGDYQNGDTATIVGASRDYVTVSWLTRTSTSGSCDPICLLFPREVEVIKQDEAPNLSDWGDALRNQPGSTGSPDQTAGRREDCRMKPYPKWPARLSAPIYAMDTTAASWWQSRHGLRNPPQLTDLRELARTIWRNAR